MKIIATFLKGVLGVIAVLIIYAVITVGSKKEAEKMEEEIHDKVAEDLVEQFEIAKRQGDKIQTCVQAGIVAAAFLQSKNEPEYRKWKAVEKFECRRAGMPQ